jgi:hypothetical protein
MGGGQGRPCVGWQHGHAGPYFLVLDGLRGIHRHRHPEPRAFGGSEGESLAARRLANAAVAHSFPRACEGVPVAANDASTLSHERTYSACLQMWALSTEAWGGRRGGPKS